MLLGFEERTAKALAHSLEACGDVRFSRLFAQMMEVNGLEESVLFFFGNCRVGSLENVGAKKKGIRVFARQLVMLLKVGSINALGLYAL